jgi:hypothetical protein
MITTFYFRGKILKNKYLTFSYIYKKAHPLSQADAH